MIAVAFGKEVHLDVRLGDTHWQLYPLLVHTLLRDCRLSTGFLNIGMRASKYCSVRAELATLLILKGVLNTTHVLSSAR